MGSGQFLTSRLDLRPLALSDLDYLHPVLSDPQNFQHNPAGPKASREDSRAWIGRFSARWAGDGPGYWTVRLRDTGTVIGVGGAERRPAFWNLYYLLGPRYRGHGYATELAAAAHRHAMAADAALPVVAWIHRDNTASQAVARRVGLTDYGQLERQHWDGAPMHCWADRLPRLAP